LLRNLGIEWQFVHGLWQESLNELIDEVVWSLELICVRYPIKDNIGCSLVTQLQPIHLFWRCVA
jgi:hypothetical protein